MKLSRRKFIKGAGLVAGSALIPSQLLAKEKEWYETGGEITNGKFYIAGEPLNHGDIVVCNQDGMVYKARLTENSRKIFLVKAGL